VLAGAGSYHAGCRISALNNLGWVTYSVTIWQDFTTDGTKITALPPQALDIVTYYGWVVTSSSSSHWWVTKPQTAAARGNYTLTQYVAGQPYQSRTGWVQVNVSYKGTWSCSST
jgi:hypothetical protein